MRREEEKAAERMRMEESILISRDGRRVYDGRNEYEVGRGGGEGRGDYRSRDGRLPTEDRRASHSSETATINFFHDDREDEWEEEVIEEKRSKSFNFTHSIEPIERRDDRIGGIERRLRSLEEEGREERGSRRHRPPPPPPLIRNSSSHSMAVDYSSRDFQQSLAAIDAASRERDGVRVTHQGDTTIVTEHRDPYSFYWQLDQARRPDSPPRPRPPATDYIIDEEEVQETVLSPHSHDSGVVSESQYSRPVPLPPRSLPTPVMERDDSPHRPLPAGWEKHQDPSGFSYYWHVDSGKIQRDPPRVPPPARSITPPPQPSPPVYAPPSRPTPQPPRVSPPPPQIIQLPPQQPVIEEHAFKQTTTKRRVENEESVEDGRVEEAVVKPVRFAVRSLGWVEMGEEEISAERSSKAVNGAIAQLSNGRGMEDGVARWGDGRELIMEMDENELRLLDPHEMNLLHTEKIHNIRVWGVGRENGRDFAYVARERGSRRLLCHVFRCDTPAKTIANTLRDICRKIVRGSGAESVTSERRLVRSSELTAVDEPKKLIRCHFIGVTQVPRANGIDVLNDAVDRLVSQVGRHQWILSDVSIAPSTLIISEVTGAEIASCRVRYLSFLGIGRDIKHCAFIMQVSSDSFLCYVFHVEPSAAVMAKTIEAACKLRYQKLLDAHRPDHLSIGKEECGSPLLFPSPMSNLPPLSLPPSHSLPLSLNSASPSFSPTLSSLPSSSSFDQSRLQVWYNSLRGAFSRLPSLSH
ncbi:hypothetical protein PMAYCL1PPCAC_12401 [Pristionchus mayeri]|uniref:Uncharacterized protein n=1 Tax=Pristionchus mayeri TaxID=1317129 RepID=A0AAN4ZNK0_9BILA|nr:hypothetical protein PMAYCL1PPCAC_12401 [Pristionchus mayeri]